MLNAQVQNAKMPLYTEVGMLLKSLSIVHVFISFINFGSAYFCHLSLCYRSFLYICD